MVVAATVPVEYTYYLDLDESWDFVLREGTLVVLAPEIRFNTPALDVSRLHELGWRHSIPLREGIESTYRWFRDNYDAAVSVRRPAALPV